MFPLIAQARVFLVASPNHGPVYLSVTHRADTESAGILIPPHDLTLNRLSGDEICQFLSGLFPAGVDLALPLAGLPTLGSIYTVEPDRNASQLDRVAVNYVCLTGERGSYGRMNQQ